MRDRQYARADGEERREVPLTRLGETVYNNGEGYTGVLIGFLVYWHFGLVQLLGFINVDLSYIFVLLFCMSSSVDSICAYYNTAY